MPRIVPSAWMPRCTMKRIIVHWTAGTHKASQNDREHYHILINDNGELVRGIPPITGNASPRKGTPAHHTRNCNTESIGVSLCCMGGAEEKPFHPGKWPLTQEQWNQLPLVLADLCEVYNIRVTSKTVLSHAEVQKNLGIKQLGKWDISKIPLPTAKQCGDQFRASTALALAGNSVEPPAAEEEPEDGGEPEDPPLEAPTAVMAGMGAVATPLVVSGDVRGDPELYGIQKRLHALNYSPGGFDGIWGGMTAGAITAFLNDTGSTIQAPTSLAAFKHIQEPLKDALSAAETGGYTRRISPERANATGADIAPKLVSVQQTLWSKFWAKVQAAVATAIAMFWGAMEWLTNSEQTGPIVDAISRVPRWAWLGTALVVFGTLAGLIWRTTRKTEEAVVGQFREGKIA